MKANSHEALAHHPYGLFTQLPELNVLAFLLGAAFGTAQALIYFAADAAAHAVQLTSRHEGAVDCQQLDQNSTGGAGGQRGAAVALLRDALERLLIAAAGSLPGRRVVGLSRAAQDNAHLGGKVAHVLPILVCGAKGVGKTRVLRALGGAGGGSGGGSTVGVDMVVHEANIPPHGHVILLLWELSGAASVDALPRGFHARLSGLVLVADRADPASCSAAALDAWRDGVLDAASPSLLPSLAVTTCSACRQGGACAACTRGDSGNPVGAWCAKRGWLDVMHLADQAGSVADDVTALESALIELASRSLVDRSA